MAIEHGRRGFRRILGCAPARVLFVLALLGILPTLARGQADATSSNSTARPPTSPIEMPAIAVATLDQSSAIAIATIDRPPTIDTGLPLYAAPTRLDRIGRVLASVVVDARGPFRFVVDTGANRTAISKRLAQTLGLQVDPAATVEVHGVTGSAMVPAVDGMRLQVGEIDMDPRQLPVLENDVFADADGILGVEGLRNSRVEVDFVKDRVTVQRSTGKRAPKGFLVVPARTDHGGLMLVRGRVGRVRTEVVLDTGAQYTIGNLALYRALLATGRRKGAVDSTVFGATPGSVEAISVTTPPIKIGDAELRDVSVTFADLHVFSLWDLTDVPALVVGMDVLGTVDRFIVDYGRSEFQFRPGRGIASTQAENTSCVRGSCRTGSRLPR